MTRTWRTGDRVRLTPTGRAQDMVTATVRGYSELTGGVYVELDRPVRGVTTALASPEELTAVHDGVGAP